MTGPDQSGPSIIQQQQAPVRQSVPPRAPAVIYTHLSSVCPALLSFMSFSSATRSVWWPAPPPRRPAAPRRPATQCPAGSPPASRGGSSLSSTPSNTSGPSTSCRSRAPWTAPQPTPPNTTTTATPPSPTHRHCNQSHRCHHQPLADCKAERA